MTAKQAFFSAGESSAPVRAMVSTIASQISDLIEDAEAFRRPALKTARTMLLRAYGMQHASETDVAQFCAEEDGDAIEDAP